MKARPTANLHRDFLSPGSPPNGEVLAAKSHLEAKSARKITGDHLRGLRHLQEDHPEVNTRVVVCLEAKKRRTEDGIWILPAESFCRRLWGGGGSDHPAT